MKKKPSLVRVAVLRIVLLLAAAAIGIVTIRAMSGCAPSRPDPATFIARGDVARMPDNRLIVVMNPDGVKHGVHEYEYGAQCLALQGDPLTVVAFDGDRVLVRHDKPVEWFYGVCVPGVLTFVTKEEFARMNDRYAEAKAKAAEERELVRRLLAHQGENIPDHAE